MWVEEWYACHLANLSLSLLGGLKMALQRFSSQFVQKLEKKHFFQVFKVELEFVAFLQRISPFISFSAEIWDTHWW